MNSACAWVSFLSVGVFSVWLDLNSLCSLDQLSIQEPWWCKTKHLLGSLFIVSLLIADQFQIF